MINRRTFLQALAAVSGGFIPCALARAKSARADEGEKIILTAPLTHSDWMLKAGMAWGEAGVRHMLDACKACGWSRIYWRVLDGGRAMYKSRLVKAEGKWDEDSFWRPKSEQDRRLMEKITAGMTAARREEILGKFESLDYQHFDPLASAIRYGHQIGLQIHAWVSINEDDHGWGLQSDFSKRHPEFRWRRRDGRVYHSQLSFAFPEVREYKLAILGELLDGYAIDGLFLDWIRTGDVRDNPQTDPAGVADSGYEQPLIDACKSQLGVDPRQIPKGDAPWIAIRAAPQTTFMREVRKLVDARKPRVPIAVLVGHPWHYRGMLNKIDGNLRGLLLDVGAWAREALMDAAVAAGYYRDGGTPKLAWNALRKETAGKVDVWTYAWVPQNVAEFEASYKLARELGAGQILFWEADYIDDRPIPRN
ncbi:MAG TPA: family 10 glycosylhydrolase [Tepidisphaeraceae bacterium]|nr:family 10 glycosylhydrolase [Tepidisphaeraceae bacterium]